MLERPEPGASSSPPIPADRSSLVLRAAATLALLIALAAAYAPALSGEFLTYDDDKYVTANAMVQGGLRPEGVVWAFTAIHDANWIPLVWLSLMADHDLYGLDPAGYHATNVLLHALSTLLLLLALARLSGSFWCSFAVAGVFALHPLHVQSVAWISERKDVLSGVFWMGTLLFWARYVERPSPARLAAVHVPFALGLLCKSTLVTLPFVLLLLDVWPTGRLDHARARGASLAGAGLRLVAEKLGLFALAAAGSAVTYHAQSSAGATAMFHLDLTDRIANAVLAYGVYLRRMVWPDDLSFFHRHLEVTIGSPEVVATAAALGALTLGVVVAASRHAGARPACIGWLWYLGTLVPMIGIVQVGAQGMADRYTYLTMTGVSIAVVWSLAAAFVRWGRAGRIAAGASLALVLGLCAVATHGEATSWQRSESLYRAALAADPDNYNAHYELARFLNATGRHAESEHHAREAVRILPFFADAYLNLGAALAGQGRHEEAIGALRRALARRPGSYEARVLLCNALVANGQLEAARLELQRLLELQPGLAAARLSLATVELQLGAREAGLAQLFAVLQTPSASALWPDAATQVVATIDAWPDAGRPWIERAHELARELARGQPDRYGPVVARLSQRLGSQAPPATP